MIVKVIDGYKFECETPSILWPADLPDTQLAYDGKWWWLTSRGSTKAFDSRRDAVEVLQRAWREA